MLFHLYAEVENPLGNKSKIFWKLFYYWSLWKKQPAACSQTVLSWWERVKEQSEGLVADAEFTSEHPPVTQGRAGQHRIYPAPQLMKITAHSQCQIKCNSWQRKTIKIIKQFLGFRGIKMSNWRLTTPTQGHFSKLSRDYQKYKSIQIKALCEQRGLIYRHPNGKHWLHTFHTFSLVGW